MKLLNIKYPWIEERDNNSKFNTIIEDNQCEYFINIRHYIKKKTMSKGFGKIIEHIFSDEKHYVVEKESYLV